VPEGLKEDPVRLTHSGGWKYRDCFCAAQTYYPCQGSSAFAEICGSVFLAIKGGASMRGMTNITTTLYLSLASSDAFAHGGHVKEATGHSHWIGLAAIGAISVLALLIAKSSIKKSDMAKKDAVSDSMQS
jgi:hypothetical protein